MANIQHGTCNTTATVTADADYDWVTVITRSAQELYFRWDGTIPAVGQTDAYVVPGAIGQSSGPWALPSNSTNPVTVKLVSSASATYTVIFS